MVGVEDPEGSPRGKVVKRSRGREMVKSAVDGKGQSVRLACRTFGISETCYRYQPKLSDENAEIADWLMRITHNQRNWGFGLYFFCFCATRKVSVE